MSDREIDFEAGTVDEQTMMDLTGGETVVPQSVLGSLDVRGRAWKRISRSNEHLTRFADAVNFMAKEIGWSSSCKAMYVAEHVFAEKWVDAGSVVYELTHDIASMFAFTSAPAFDWNNAPHSAFVISVPRSLFPAVGTVQSDQTWILASDNGALVVPDWDTTAMIGIAYAGSTTSEDEQQHHTAESRLCMRYLANLVSYVTQHRDRVEQKTATGRRPSVSLVRPPSDVVVTREFRDAARAAVASSDLKGIRRALAHVVRGHWRNQPVGEGRKERKLTWVRPHKRGDESLGRVVQRIERLRAPL